MSGDMRAAFGDSVFTDFAPSIRLNRRAAILSNLLEKFMDLDMPVDHMPRQFCFEKPFDIRFPKIHDYEKREISSYEEDSIIIFTDESRKMTWALGHEFSFSCRKWYMKSV